MKIQPFPTSIVIDYLLPGIKKVFVIDRVHLLDYGLQIMNQV